MERMNPMEPLLCGARTRQGHPCRRAALRGRRRCRMHGGHSTGPRTPEGLEHSRGARWVHGRFSEKTRRARAAAVERSQAEMWEELAIPGIARGFIAEPVRQRGFHGVRLRRPHGWERERTRMLQEALKALERRFA